MSAGSVEPRWMTAGFAAALIVELLDTLALDCRVTALSADLPADLHPIAALTALAAGGTLVLADPRADQLAAHVAQAQPTALFASVAALEALVAGVGAPPSLQHAITADGALRARRALYQQLAASGVRWHNLLGLPDFAAVGACRELDGELTRVAKLLPMALGFVLDDAGQPVPAQLSGHLQLAARERATEDDPARRLESLRPHLVSSGWRARWLGDGTLALDRPVADALVLPGALVAAGDLERLIAQHPRVAECALTASADRAGYTAWLAPRAATAATDLAAEIDRYLEEALAASDIPLGVCLLPRLPRVAGELARDALRACGQPNSRERARLAAQLAALPGITRVAVDALAPAASAPPIDLAALADAETADAAAPATLSDVRSTSTLPWAYHRGEEITVDRDGPTTLPAALARAATNPAEDALAYVDADETSGCLRWRYESYAQLLERAQRTAGALGALGVRRGERVIVQIDDIEAFMPALWGCLWAGVVPLVLKVPLAYDASQGLADKFRSTWQFLGAPLVLSARAHEPALIEAREQGVLPGLRHLTVEQLAPHAQSVAAAAVAPEDVALIQVTSGSTGAPKCIQLSHRSLVAHARSSMQRNQVRDDDRFASWLPLDHVGSLLLFHLRVVYAALPQAHARPEVVLGDPLRWLDILHRFRATDTWAPSFAFKLVVEALARGDARDWDLSAMRRITNGAEQVSVDVAAEFLRRLAPHGLSATCMRPAFGMAEMCSAITHAPPLRAESGEGLLIVDRASLGGELTLLDRHSPEGLVFADLGPVNPGAELRIVDGEGELLRERHIGRVQFRGDVIMVGYLDNDEANRAAFVGDGWFNTGDLGFLSDGHLVLTGREKEVIRLRGNMFYCHEIEALAACDGVEPTFVAAVPVWDERGEEACAVFFSPTAAASADDAVADTAQRIRERIARALGVGLHAVVPVDSSSFPKTTSGKIQRRELRRRFEASARPTLGPAAATTLPAWFYARTWTPARAGRVPLAEPRRYLVVHDHGGLAEALCAPLAGELVHVRPGEAFTCDGARSYCLRPGVRADAESLQAALAAEDLWPSDIVYCASARSGAPADEDTVRQLLEREVFGLLDLLRGLAGAAPAPVRLFVITRGCFAVAPGDGGDGDLARGALPGLLRTLSAELGWLDPCLLDLGARADDADDADADDAEIAAARAEIESGPRAPEVAFRGATRLLRTLEPLRPASGALAPLPLERGGLYLVTGGLGGAGVQVSRWLTQALGARLLLVGRSTLDGDESSSAARARRSAYEALRQSGAELRYRALDVADATALADAISEAEARWDAPLAGVFHLAGVGDLADHWQHAERHRLLSETRAEIEEMFRAKVYGTLALARALETRPRAAFIAFSSVNALFGGVGVGAYAAANSFLDRAIDYLRERGERVARTLNWSMWEGVGMARSAPQRLRELSESHGFCRIRGDQSIRSLDLALRFAAIQTAIGLDPAAPAIRRELPGVAPERSGLRVGYVAADPAEAEAELREAVTRAYPALDLLVIEPEGDARLPQDVEVGAARPFTNSERLLAEVWNEVLGVADFGLDDDFYALGGDSIKSVQVIARASKRGLTLAPKEFLYQSTLRALARVADERRATGDRPTLDEFARDAVLADDIQPTAPPVETVCARPLLTGATGFVGAFLLRELVDRGCDEVHCLVRAPSEAEATERVRRNLDFYGLWSPAVANVLRPVLGDLTAAHLGLSEAQFRALGERVDAIVHCGASANLVLPYRTVKAVNIDSVAWMLRLATTHTRKPLHFVSTLGVLAPGVGRTEELIPVASEAAPFGGYLQSKWVAEKLLTQAHARGFPVSIYRLGRVTGHSERGVAKTDDYFHSFINACLNTMRFPALDREVSLVPVDFISRAIVYLAQRRRAIAGADVYHLTNLQTAASETMLEWVRARGYPIEIVPPERWLDEALRPGQLAEDDRLYPFMGLLDEERALQGDLGKPPDMSAADCANLIAGLAGSGIQCPPVDLRLFNVYIDYFLACGLMPATEAASAPSPSSALPR
ncbi:MAG: hypothetical protein Tsb0020_33160 [Haliangiales bacterium]